MCIFDSGWRPLSERSRPRDLYGDYSREYGVRLSSTSLSVHENDYLGTGKSKTTSVYMWILFSFLLFSVFLSEFLCFQVAVFLCVFSMGGRRPPSV